MFKKILLTWELVLKSVLKNFQPSYQYSKWVSNIVRHLARVAWWLSTGLRTNIVRQGFLNFNIHQSHLECLLKYTILSLSSLPPQHLIQ